MISTNEPPLTIETL